MTPFAIVSSRAIALPTPAIDTDIIYPARFLLVAGKTGLGRYAFYDQRHAADGSVCGASPFDDPAFAGAAILVAGDNFGCGSSREQAPWALADLGVRALISTSFGEIFQNNCFRNGMLPVTVGAADLAALLAQAAAGAALTVDLVARRIVRADGAAIAFAIEDWRRDALLNGWDEIDTIRALHAPAIAAFEARQHASQPWLWADA